MKIGFASDHAGYDLKERLKAWAIAQGHEAVDFGTDGPASVDYPDFAHRAATAKEKWERLVLVCGSGIGISIAANRHAGIRCALVTSHEHAQLARQHNDANAIAFGQRLTDPLQAESYLKTFLETPFENGRHQGRVDKIEII
ncbi:RpiB/LacA/LacB family sugar-phosphate isomerase [Holophaga foetida]|uniref:RpiB/LacA/LacB family sugar-phosphate isomerase n=1 Tax=Holophaga foetida TaxID=35839 RepID=UPI0002474D3A|nr:RpiB/LacA/LacB family sugar-phosphate isomerase [Holophaga foetida]